jgi:hypothetical protein
MITKYIDITEQEFNRICALPTMEAKVEKIDVDLNESGSPIQRIHFIKLDESKFAIEVPGEVKIDLNN